jgi:hypothetical protein
VVVAGESVVSSPVDLEAKRHYIDAIDFTLAKDRILTTARGPAWTPARADYVERQYKNWFFLRVKHPGVEMVPSRDIDEYWHVHILDTEAYHRDSMVLFDGYLHHRPYLLAPGDPRIPEEIWSRVQQLYLEEYGEVIYDYEDEDANEDDEDSSRT